MTVLFIEDRSRQTSTLGSNKHENSVHIVRYHLMVLHEDEIHVDRISGSQKRLQDQTSEISHADCNYTNKSIRYMEYAAAKMFLHKCIMYLYHALAGYKYK